MECKTGSILVGYVHNSMLLNMGPLNVAQLLQYQLIELWFTKNYTISTPEVTQ